LQLAAQLSSELPLLQSEEELTVRAKGPRLQPAEIFSELQLPRPVAETMVLLTEAEPLRQQALVRVKLAQLELE
jgi:predicted transcriptional regulator